jgi:hypothetical protein
VEGDRLVEHRQPGLMGQQVAGGDPRLPRDGELGPGLGYRGVDVEQAALPEQQRGHRGRALGG